MAEKIVFNIIVDGKKATAELKGFEGGLKRLDRSTTAASRSTQKMTKDVSEFERTMQRARRTVIAFVAVMLGRELLGGFVRLVKTGVEFNAQIETAKLGIASILSSTGDITDQTGKQVQGYQKLIAAQRISAGIIKDIQKANLETFATFEQIVRAYQETLPVAAGRGWTPEQTLRFTKVIVQAAGAIGLNMDMLAEETRSLLTGVISPRTSRIATILAGANLEEFRKQIKDLQYDSQGLFDLLMGMLKEYELAGKESQKTWAALLSNMKDIFKISLGEAMIPLFERLKVLLADLQTFFGTAGFKSLMSDIGNAMVGIVNALEKGAKFLAEWRGAIGSIAKLLGAYTAGRIGGAMAKGLPLLGMIPGIGTLATLGITGLILGKENIAKFVEAFHLMFQLALLEVRPLFLDFLSFLKNAFIDVSEFFGIDLLKWLAKFEIAFLEIMAKVTGVLRTKRAEQYQRHAEMRFEEYRKMYPGEFPEPAGIGGPRDAAQLLWDFLSGRKRPTTGVIGPPDTEKMISQSIERAISEIGKRLNAIFEPVDQAKREAARNRIIDEIKALFAPSGGGNIRAWGDIDPYAGLPEKWSPFAPKGVGAFPYSEKELMVLQEKYIKNIRNEYEEWYHTLKEIDLLFLMGMLSEEVHEKWLARLYAIEDVSKGIMENFRKVISTVFEDFMMKEMKSFSDYWHEFWNMLAKTMADIMAKQFQGIIDSLIQALTGAGGSEGLLTKGFMTLFNAAVSYFTKAPGGGTGAGMPHEAAGGWGTGPGYQYGGITRGPSLAGERGPEAIVPLPHNRMIPVEMKSPTNVNHNYYIRAVDAKSFRDMVRRDPSAIKTIIHDDLRYNEGIGDSIRRATR